MIVIKDVSRTNSSWDLGSWAVRSIFLRQLWDCQEDAATMTVTINNLHTKKKREIVIEVYRRSFVVAFAVLHQQSRRYNKRKNLFS